MSRRMLREQSFGATCLRVSSREWEGKEYHYLLFINCHRKQCHTKSCGCCLTEKKPCLEIPIVSESNRGLFADFVFVSSRLSGSGHTKQPQKLATRIDQRELSTGTVEGKLLWRTKPRTK